MLARTLRYTLAFSVTLGASGTLAAQELTPQAMLRLAPLPRAAFLAAWDSLRAIDEAAAADSGAASPRARARVRHRWAQGVVLRPYFHWREGSALAVEPDTLVAVIRAQTVREPLAWQSLPEYRQLLEAVIHESARTRIATDPALATGDNRWLRAEFEVVESMGLAPEARWREAHRLLWTHIDDNGAKNVDAIVDRYRAMAPRADSLAKVVAARDADLARREGHDIHTYATRDGVPLEVHVLPPTRTDSAAAPAGAKPAPAMLWLHGGSLNEGAWWHCPVICTTLRANGVTVIAVELRTGNRFESGPLEQLEDAAEALRWAQANAARLGVDRARIGVAGFSSGATITLVLAARGVEPVGERPAAFIALGGCADPIAPHEDGFFRKRLLAAGKDAAAFSPLALARAGLLRDLPPLLAIHGADDEYCAVDDIRQFVGAVPPASTELTTLVVVPEAPHFFPFFDRAGQQRVREAVGAALQGWGWER